MNTQLSTTKKLLLIEVNMKKLLLIEVNMKKLLLIEVNTWSNKTYTSLNTVEVRKIDTKTTYRT